MGNPDDYKVPDEASRLTGGILLAGGSTDQDSAMKWFLGKAQGGDVIVFRNARNSTSTSDYPTADAYNPYLYSELGVLKLIQLKLFISIRVMLQIMLK